MAIKISTGDARKVWCCNGCDEVVDEPVALYECGQCSTVFSRDGGADGNSHKCPECNKFAAKLTDHGCADCEMECEEVMAVEADEWVVIEDMAIR